MSGSGISWAICKSAPCSRQITTPAPRTTPALSFLQAGCRSCHVPTNSVKALKAVLNNYQSTANSLQNLRGKILWKRLRFDRIMAMSLVCTFWTHPIHSDSVQANRHLIDICKSHQSENSKLTHHDVSKDGQFSCESKYPTQHNFCFLQIKSRNVSQQAIAHSTCRLT